MSVHQNIYQPWNPKRLELAATADTPSDLILQLSDHPIDPTKVKPEDHERVLVKEGIYNTTLVNRANFDLLATVKLIKYLSEQYVRYQTTTQAIPANKALPFVCHFHAAPDPLSPAWLPTFVQLLEQTAPFRVQWSTFTDGTFWDDHALQPKQAIEAQSHQDFQLAEKRRCLGQIVRAINDNRLNIMLHVDGANSSGSDYLLQHAKLQCKQQLYGFAGLLAKTGLTNLCVAIDPTYANSSKLASMMQEAVLAGAQPVLGRPQVFEFYRKFYRSNPFLRTPLHYRNVSLTLTSNDPQILAFNDWCDRQKTPLPHYQHPTCTLSRTALFLSEDNQLSVSTQSACSCSCNKGARHELGSISGDAKLQPPTVLQLVREYRKHHHAQPSTSPKDQVVCDCPYSRALPH